ncbi:TonB-dependent receptor plug domain-containing protein [Flavobacterium aquatile]|nr:TonB-dependent receptor [Flavobacterium aquatile]GEC77356.1 TonB-dependent receptor [Flavobacterium aquatile]
MKKLLLFLFMNLFLQNLWAQKIEKHQFSYSSEALDKVVLDVENKFSVKYSYVDEILNDKTISLVKKKYSLDEINLEIEKQTHLKIVKIDNRFYSLVKNEEENSEKITYLDVILIEGFLAKGINKTNEKYIIYPQKVETLPGVTDADVLLSLQQLPGVKSPNETATGLHVRGGTSDQNLVLWDGIRLYHPGHLFGMISGINPAISQSVNFYNKAVNPKFGERISSIIDIKSSDKIVGQLEGNAGLNALNADLDIKAPLLKEKLGIQVAVRKSVTEWFQSPTFRQLEDKVFQNTVFNNFDDQNKFQFQDFSTKLNFKPTENASISLSGIYIDNDLKYTNKTKDSSTDNQQMNISNYGFSINWSQKYSSRFHQKVLLFYSNYDFDYEKKEQFSPSEFEAYKKVNRITDSGLEANFNYLFNSKFTLDFGYQLFGNDVSHLFNTFNQDLGVVLSLKQVYTINHVGYSYLKFDAKNWSLYSGFRLSKFSTNGTVFEPRVLVQKRFSEHFIWQISYERRSQILSQVRENTINDLSLENYVWALSDNSSYPIQKANHFATGIILKKDNWLLDLDIYRKQIDGITTSTFGFSNQNVTSIYKGNGFTNGLDLLLQKTARDWSAWMTYTFQDSQNRFETINNFNYFLVNSNVKHALNLSFNKKWNKYSVTAGWFLHSGKPYSLLDENEQATDLNAKTLPAYHRLDVSGFYQFYNKDNKNLKVGFSIYNCYNNRTVISKEFERKFSDFGDFATPRYAVKDYYSLGITPNIFVRMSF